MIRPLSSRLLLIVIWTAVCGPICAAPPSDGWQTDFDAAVELSQRLQRPLLVHFYADWCGPCKQMEQGVLNRPEVLAEIRKSVVAVKVNTDRNQEVTERFGITQLPTDLFIEPSGAKLIETSGQRSVSEYRSAIARAATRYSGLLAERARKQAPPSQSPRQPGQQSPAQLATAGPRPMLDGYCAVTLWSKRRWEKGSPQYRGEHRGQVYLLASEEALKEFQDNPDRYAPRFLGCDPVVVYESDRAVPGSTKYAAFYDEELFLFVDDINRQAFKRNPDNFVRTRVVLNVDQIETVTR